MKALLKRLARAVLGEYALYEVWQSAAAIPASPRSGGVILRAVTQADLAAAADAELRESAWYLGDEACAFGAFEGDRLLALACCWWGARYAARHSWPLPERAAKLVHIVTAPAARGRGLAPLLIQHAETALRGQGRAPLLARIWHSNEPSRRAFRRAGWRPIGWLLLINPLRRQKPWRWLCRN